ncbi:hypothetical protein [Daejeonella sp.]|jgi:hypothetical protein|uniref:hypothetical protein n=1 Tax=Daejeonella sp. TaxID=2805397 RepID=UPI003784181B
MKNSPNTNMKQVFEHLANIKLAEPSPNLYSQTLNKLKKRNIIPLFWLRATACFLISLITTEFYIVSNKEKIHKELSSNVILKTNNILYNE